MSSLSRSQAGWLVLRLALAGLIAAHGYYRLINGGIAPFGGWLETQGVPFGLAIAWAVTIAEIIGSALLVIGRLVFLTSLLLSVIYVAGIVLVHAPAGWFVVGAGRNGVEYSVLLIVALLCVGAQYAPGSQGPR